MKAMTRLQLTLTIALLAGTAMPTPAFELASSRIDANGGGRMTGGAYSAFVTIAATGPAGPMHGSVYEATAGIERRRVPLGEALFKDGFETHFAQ